MSEQSNSYNPQNITEYFDEFAMGEWERLVASPVAEISLYLHTHYLQTFIQGGETILEVGAGAGRFTQILTQLDTQITVADISQIQLDLNRQFANHLTFAQHVQAWQQLDMCDMHMMPSGTFDCVVAYGGPLSYVMEKRDVALAECLRVLKPGGLLFCSVMSLWGSAHRGLKSVLEISPQTNQVITSTGDLTPETINGSSQSMHLFRSTEFRQFLENHNLTILALSASGCLGINWQETLDDIRNDEEKWGELLRMEREASAEAGCLDMGTHLIAVAQKPS